MTTKFWKRLMPTMQEKQRVILSTMISWQILQNPLGLSSIKTFNFADIMKIFTDNLGFVGKMLGSANFERPGVQVQYFPSLHITRYVLSCL